MFTRMLHQTQDLRYRTLTKGLCNANLNHTREVYTTRNHLVALCEFAWQTFTCQSDRIQRGAAFRDDTVQRHFLARTHQNDVAYLHFFWIHIVERFLVCTIYMGDVRTYIHQMGYAFATFTFCITLKEFTYLEKQHDKNRLREFCLSTRQKTDAEGTDGCYRHQEVLIKGISFYQSLDGFL